MSAQLDERAQATLNLWRKLPARERLVLQLLVELLGARVVDDEVVHEAIARAQTAREQAIAQGSLFVPPEPRARRPDFLPYGDGE